MNWLNKENIKHEYVASQPEICEEKLNHSFKKEFKEIVNSFLLHVDDGYKQILIPEGYNINNHKLKEVFNTKKLRICNSDEPLIESGFYETIIDSNLLTGLDDLFIKNVANNNHVKIKKEDINQISNKKVLDLGLLPKYKAKVNFVSPLSMRDDFLSFEDPFFGISLENTNFIRPKLLASLEWISNRFSKCTVLIGDSIHRITLKTTQNLNEEEAEKRALFLGRDFIFNECHVFERFKNRCQFNFLFCSEIQKYFDYKEYHQNLNILFQNDIDFKFSVESFSENYHEKRRCEVSENEWNKLISSSCAYFLEEFAIFACLQKRGKSVMIYPGSFSTLTEIAAGSHPKALEELKQLIVVSLHLKKR